MEKLDFAKYYDITELVKDNIQYEGNERVYIYIDTWVFWIARIVANHTYDETEGYVPEKGSYILERNDIQKDNKGQGIYSLKELNAILEKDDGSNWDVNNCDSVDIAKELLDDGFGLGIIKEGELK